MLPSAFLACIKERRCLTHTTGRIALTVANERLKYASAFDIEDKT
jgi:hypothetical protein